MKKRQIYSPKKSLNPRLIFKTALEILDESGIDALSMRVLAQRLQVKAASLYNHVPNKAALLDGVQDLVFSTITPPPISLEWKKYFTKLAYAFRDVLRSHPNAAILFASRPAVSSVALRIADNTLSCLSKAGFSVVVALYLYQSLAVFVIGHAFAELDPKGLENPKKQEMDAAFMKHFSNLAQVPIREAQDMNAWFKLGVEFLIRGADAILNGS